jgi:alanine dehydrogenase
MLILSESDVRQLVPIPDLIDLMQSALAQFSTGNVEQPLRAVLEVGTTGFFGVMPAFIPAAGALGTKLVTVFGGNASRDLPTHLATILLLDSTTGQLLALLDGRYITEARTAAVSAVSARLLAREGAATLAIIGSGVQARSHLQALAHVRTLREVRVWSPISAHREAFAREMQAVTAARIHAVSSAREAVASADLVALVSSAREPVLSSDWIADGAHICAVGACRPDQREMDTALVRRARLYVDSRTGALAEAGDIVLPINEGVLDEHHIVGELGEVAAGAIRGRTAPSEVTIFKSLGMAVEDVAAAHLAVARAREQGIGLDLDSSWATASPSSAR